MAQTYRVRKPIKVGYDRRDPGDLVPEAIRWFRVDHLVHAGFLVLEEPIHDQELLDALSYVDDPVVWELHGFEPPERDEAPEPEAVDEAPVAEEADEPTAEDGDGESLISQVDPKQMPLFPRAELEEMELTELRALAKDAGLDTIKKAEIIDALAED